MSLLNENISIKIKDVQLMSWDIASVSVAPRPYHALALRNAGSAKFTHGNYAVNTQKGDVFYMPAGLSYNAVYKEKNEILVIHFESDLSSKMENFCTNNSHTVLSLFQNAYHIWTEKREGYYYSAMSALCEILQILSALNSPEYQSETYQAFEAAIEYMKNHYTSAEFSIEKMVALSHMSSTYFRKLFCSKFGTTPIKYLTAQRLIYAEKLLATGKYSIAEVAEKSGFYDVKYFSRVVKKEYGVSPSKLYQHE